MYTWWMEGIAGNYDLTIWCTEQPYTAPHNFFTPMLDSSCHVPAIAVLADGDVFLATIREFSTTNDEERIADIFDYLINYSNDNVLNIPLTYVKDMIFITQKKFQTMSLPVRPCFLISVRLQKNNALSDWSEINPHGVEKRKLMLYNRARLEITNRAKYI